LQERKIYELGSIEPYPEQFDTRSIEWSTWLFAAPVELYKETLINEWHDPNKIKVVWNTVVDAIEISKKKIKSSKAFEIYPNMKWKDFIFVTIHRRENCEKKERFLTLYYWLKKLVQEWIPVCFLELYASSFAIDSYWLRDDLNELIKNYPDNFAYWPALAHHAEVIDMISKAWAVVTDSWSMQEEANIVWTPCVTLRFWSDRTETILAWTNIIAPPVNSCLIAEIIKWAIWNKKMRGRNLYGENVSKKIVDEVLKILSKNWKLFLLDDERLGLEKYTNWKI
jgi:UDP-N-acetylglucosamine 2-epimerase (non-hydrolysing)